MPQYAADHGLLLDDITDHVINEFYNCTAIHALCITEPSLKANAEYNTLRNINTYI